MRTVNGNTGSDQGSDPNFRAKKGRRVRGAERTDPRARRRARQRNGFFLMLLLLGLEGCYWSRYGDVMRTHLEVMDQYAKKLAELAEDGRTVSAQDWGEFSYPLARARDFARIARRRYAAQPSLRSFDQSLDRYGDLVGDPGILARPDGPATVAARVASLHAATAATRQALEQEEGG